MNSQCAENDSKIKNFIVNYYPLFFVFVLLTFTAITAYKMMEFPYFFISDQFQHFEAINKERGALFHPAGPGRFYPLTCFEFYLVLSSWMDLDSMMFFVYVIQATKFVLFSLLLFYILKLYSGNTFIAFVAFGAFIISSKTFLFMSTFAHTIIPETMLLLVLTLFFLFYFYAHATDKIVYYILAFVAVNYSLYLKEPVFSIFIVFSFMHLVFFRKVMSKREKYFQFSILFSCVFFLCLYFLLAHTSGSRYGEGFVQINVFEFLEQVLIKYNFIIPIVIGCARLYFVAIRKYKVVLADVLLLMSLAYTSCFLVLVLNSGYYFIPAYFLLCIAYAGYAKIIMENYGGKLRIRFCFPIVCLSVLVVSVLLVREPLRRDFYGGFKITTHEFFKIAGKIKNLGKDIVFYLHAPDEYEVPFHFGQYRWLSTAWSHFLENNLIIEKKSDMKKLESDEFIKVLDKGAVGIVLTITTQIKSAFIEKYPQYEVLDIGSTAASMVVHEDDLAWAVPLYCEFAKNLDEQATGKVNRRSMKEIFRKAKEIGCNLSL